MREEKNVSVKMEVTEEIMVIKIKLHRSVFIW